MIQSAIQRDTTYIFPIDIIISEHNQCNQFLTQYIDIQTFWYFPHHGLGSNWFCRTYIWYSCLLVVLVTVVDAVLFNTKDNNQEPQQLCTCHTVWWLERHQMALFEFPHHGFGFYSSRGRFGWCWTWCVITLTVVDLVSNGWRQIFTVPVEFIREEFARNCK